MNADDSAAGQSFGIEILHLCSSIIVPLRKR